MAEGGGGWLPHDYYKKVVLFGKGVHFSLQNCSWYYRFKCFRETVGLSHCQRVA